MVHYLLDRVALPWGGRSRHSAQTCKIDIPSIVLALVSQPLFNKYVTISMKYQSTHNGVRLSDGYLNDDQMQRELRDSSRSYQHNLYSPRYSQAILLPWDLLAQRRPAAVAPFLLPFYYQHSFGVSRSKRPKRSSWKRQHLLVRTIRPK